MNKNKEWIFPTNKQTKYPVLIRVKFKTLINKNVLKWLFEKYLSTKWCKCDLSGLENPFFFIILFKVT